MLFIRMAAVSIEIRGFPRLFRKIVMLGRFCAHPRRFISLGGTPGSRRALSEVVNAARVQGMMHRTEQFDVVLQFWP
jgi:hypothetical protein